MTMTREQAVKRAGDTVRGLGPRLLSMPDVMGYTGLGYQTIYRDVQSGALKAMKLKKRLRFQKAEVDRWLKRELSRAN